MRYVYGLLFVATLCAQDALPGFTRGTLVRAEGGSIEVRPVNGKPLFCTFDTRTWIERDKKRAGMDALESGVPVEVLTDVRAGRCYTRTIRLVNSLTPVAAPTRRLPTRSPLLENLFPRGNMTFGGVVLRSSPTVLVLRTRTEPEKVIRLRDDTRFLDSGVPVSAADIAVNTRVFVRAGKSFENVLEAYQVVWGEIAGPATHTQR